MTPLPPDTLRATYMREQPYRVNWPTEYEIGMSDPIISRLVEMLTRHQVPTINRPLSANAFDKAWNESLNEQRAAYKRACTCSIGQCKNMHVEGNYYCRFVPRELDQKRRASGEREDCPMCNGVGIAPTLPNQTCPDCNGTGYK